MQKFAIPTLQERLSAIGLRQNPDGSLRDTCSRKRRTSFSSELFAAINPENFQPIHAPKPDDWLACHKESGQTFSDFSGSDYNRVSKDSTIYIQLIGELFQHASYAPLLESLTSYAQAFFQPLTVQCLESINPAAAQQEFTSRIHGGRNQLFAPDIIKWLKKQRPENGYCVIGITMEDLYPDPEWNFVFGSASLTGRAGVYSFVRYLDAKIFNDPKKTKAALNPAKFTLDATFMARCLKVMTHECCHMFNMRHCIYFSCLLQGSNHLDESDSRPMSLCPVCLSKLHLVLGFSPLERYKSLYNVLTSIVERFGWYRSEPFEGELQTLQETIKTLEPI